jgi:hypothetical protein
MKAAIFGNTFNADNEKYFDLLISILKKENTQIIMEKEYYLKIKALKKKF